MSERLIPHGSFSVELLDLRGQLAVRQHGHTAVVIQLVDPELQLVDDWRILADSVRSVQVEIIVVPPCEAGEARRVGDRGDRRPLQELLGVEDVVDLLVLQEPVRVDAGAGHIEVAPDERRAFRNVVADLLLVVLGEVRDDGRVHPVQRALELRVLEDHGLERRVAGPLADAEQRGVDAAAAVQPGRRGVVDRAVKVVVPVPLEIRVRDAGVRVKRVNDAGHRRGS